jgi:hypothetical protein
VTPRQVIGELAPAAFDDLITQVLKQRTQTTNSTSLLNWR